MILTMKKTALAILAAGIALVGLAWLFQQSPALIAATLVAIAIGWSFAAWWFADEQPALAPFKPGRVTFKEVVLSAAADFAQVTGLAAAARHGQRLAGYWLPRLTDRTMMAAIFADVAMAAQGQDVWLWLAEHRLVAGVVIAVNLLAATPRNAPERLPS